MNDQSNAFLTAPRRVLVIDDALTNLKLMTLALSGDYEVLVAASGAQGLQMAEKERPDAILLDIAMPDMDGFEVCRKLKADPRLASTPIVFATAQRDPATEAQGLALGGTDFVSKPVKIDILKLRLRNIIDSHRVRKLVEMQNKDLSLAARLDNLTKLPNRLLLDDRLKMAMSQADRSKNPMAVVFIDLDGFKAINDQHGHAAGDHLLVALARRLQDSVRLADTVARVGGDEFVALLNNLTSQDACLPSLQRLLDAACTPVVWGDAVLSVSASIGVTFFPQAGDIDGQTLITQADQAMYQAKKSGKNSYAFFDDGRQNAPDLGLSNRDIIQGLNDGAFELIYCPELDIASGQVVAMEALLRWQHPKRGLLRPEAFLADLEGQAVAITIGEWVLRQVIEQQAAWHAQGLRVVSSIHISQYHLSQSDFFERLQQLLAAHPDGTANRLKIDTMEPAGSSELSAISHSIRQCRSLGVSFSLDDFGTGQCSLTYLRDMPINQVKLDSTLHDALTDNPGKQLVLQKLIALLQAMGYSVLAKGVETAQALQVLRRLGCEQAQGAAISAPISAQDAAEFLRTWQARGSA